MNSLILFKIKSYAEFWGTEKPRMDKSIWNVWKQWYETPARSCVCCLSSLSHPSSSRPPSPWAVLGYLNSKLLSLLLGSLARDGKQGALCLVPEVVMCWSPSLAGRLNIARSARQVLTPLTGRYSFSLPLPSSDFFKLQIPPHYWGCPEGKQELRLPVQGFVCFRLHSLWELRGLTSSSSTWEILL